MENKLDQWDIISSVGLTALAIAGLRAVETHRSDSLASDPFAELFVQAAKTEVPIPTRPDPDNLFLRLNASYVGVRTRFFDEYFTAATSAGVHQVVILAAGLDARAFRLDWAPETDLYEIDQPMVLDFKQRVLDTRGAKPKCRRHLVPIDLREDWAGALTAAGFDPSKPTAWLAEGLLSYLPGTTEEKLFDQMGKWSAPGSQFAAEIAHKPVVRDMLSYPPFRKAWHQIGVDMAALWPLDERRDCADWLRSTGWDVTTKHGPALIEEYQRPLSGSEALASQCHLLTARRVRRRGCD